MLTGIEHMCLRTGFILIEGNLQSSSAAETIEQEQMAAINLASLVRDTLGKNINSCHFFQLYSQQSCLFFIQLLTVEYIPHCIMITDIDCV